jgi:hypothetical protein
LDPDQLHFLKKLISQLGQRLLANIPRPKVVPVVHTPKQCAMCSNLCVLFVGLLFEFFDWHTCFGGQREMTKRLNFGLGWIANKGVLNPAGSNMQVNNVTLRVLDKQFPRVAQSPRRYGTLDALRASHLIQIGRSSI